MEPQTTALEASQILTLIQTSKTDRQSFINQLMDDIQAGLKNPLDMLLHLKAIEDIIFRLTSMDEKKNRANLEQARIFRQLLLIEAGRFEGKTFEYGNAKIEKKEVGVTYDWSACGDVELAQMLADKAGLDAKVKARQDWLKLAPESGVIVTDEVTGETYTCYPPIKSSTTSIAVSLK